MATLSIWASGFGLDALPEIRKGLEAEAFETWQQSSPRLDGAHLPRLQHSRVSLLAKNGLPHSPALRSAAAKPITSAIWINFRKSSLSLPYRRRRSQPEELHRSMLPRHLDAFGPKASQPVARGSPTLYGSHSVLLEALKVSPLPI